MESINKVIAGLEHCKKYGNLCGKDCNGWYQSTDDMQDIIKGGEHRSDCPYGKCETGCIVTMTSDALELLCKFKEYLYDHCEKLRGEIAEIETRINIMEATDSFR